jgi:tryptophanyl-tRNA synthetase
VDLKEALIEDVEALVAPMREKRTALTEADVKQVLQSGAERARERARAKMADVRTKIGIAL